MSIFLRGVDMPECCCGCPCCYEKADGSCFCTAVKDGEPCDIADLDQRLPNCPAEDVPEPHGDLIDADRLEDRIKNMVGKYDTAVLVRRDRDGAGRVYRSCRLCRRQNRQR